MSQDIVSDALNQVMNAKKAEKKEVKITRISKLLVNLCDMMKEAGYIDYVIEEGKKPSMVISFKKLNVCRAIKPRYSVGVEEIDKYLRRFLPSRNFGTVIVSTTKGLMTQAEAQKNNIGGSLIAYYY